ncbi:GIY-YIG nuclease family protein [Gloeothece verrucosa]|uniref:Excinuclease ABC C subunit domain protein n=1 Tax=Gloeothece verrucosa (strain PCC 7822) TaxID=497965 RepID=E0UN18_GLOV7|nr:GIY-YIG nuclease family protein [Gloeothece verrucosa]ADN18348.1 Excinuclease ABC C subunit domain protein [Gloeothece verrucosa PCC 7822]
MWEVNLSDLPFVELSTLNLLPTCPAIYFVLDSKNIIHYIGKADNLQKRWKNHHRKYQLEQIHQKYPVKIIWKVWSQKDLDLAEKYFIDYYKPLLNNTKVEMPHIIPSEIILKKLLRKIAKKVCAIGARYSTGNNLTTIYVKFDATDSTARGAAAIIRKFKAEHKDTSLKIKWSKYVQSISGIWYPIGSRQQKQQARENRAYNNHWQIFCNGVIIDITPEEGFSEINFINQKSVPWRLAGIKIRAIVEPEFTGMLNNHKLITEELLPLEALESDRDPIPLLWKNWNS